MWIGWEGGREGGREGGKEGRRESREKEREGEWEGKGGREKGRDREHSFAGPFFNTAVGLRSSKFCEMSIGGVLKEWL